MYLGPAQNPVANPVALIIGERTHRWNWQLYGYSRPTAPQLVCDTRDALMFRDVISGASGMVTSFRLMLTSAELDNKVDDEARQGGRLQDLLDLQPARSLHQPPLCGKSQRRRSPQRGRRPRPQAR